MSARPLAPVEKWRRTLKRKPEIQRYIELVYSRFRPTGVWPDIKQIQRELVQLDEDFDAFGAGAALPSELGTNPARVDGVAKLTILAVALCPDSEPDVRAFVGFVRLCVSLYKEEGDPQITQAKVTDTLNIDELGLQRLSRLIEWETFVWPEIVNDMRSWRVRQDLIHHFTKVNSLDDYLTIKDSLQVKLPRFPPVVPNPFSSIYPGEASSGTATSDRQTSVPAPWKHGRFRLFGSHLAASKRLVGDVKRGLATLAIDLFVAHADILPSREWERTILEALRTCDAIALFLVDGYQSSDWTDQEFGFALARDVQIIPINLGLQPYGFAKRFQSLPAKRLEPDEIADAVFEILINAETTGALMTDAVVGSVIAATSVADSLAAGKLLSRLSHWTPDHVNMLEQALEDNDVVAAAPGLPELISDIIRRTQ